MSSEEPQWMIDRLRELEESGVLIKHPPGWTPPRLTIDDFQTGPERPSPVLASPEPAERRNVAPQPS